MSAEDAPDSDYKAAGDAAMLAALEDNHDAAIAGFERALADPHIDKRQEMEYRSFLAGVYATTVNFSSPNYAQSPGFAQAVANMELAVDIDRGENFGYFSEPIHRARLKSLDLLYSLYADQLDKQKPGASMQYLYEKLQRFAYLASTPMLASLLQLGLTYVTAGHREEAASCWNAILSADIVDRTDGDAQTRDLARNNLEVLGQPKTASSCFIASAVYGESSPEVARLRTFRDDILLRHAAGRVLVKAYYAVSPAIARQLRRTPTAAGVLKRALDRLMNLLP